MDGNRAGKSLEALPGEASDRETHQREAQQGSPRRKSAWTYSCRCGSAVQRSTAWLSTPVRARSRTGMPQLRHAGLTGIFFVSCNAWPDFGSVTVRMPRLNDALTLSSFTSQGRGMVLLKLP